MGNITVLCWEPNVKEKIRLYTKLLFSSKSPLRIIMEFYGKKTMKNIKNKGKITVIDIGGREKEAKALTNIKEYKNYFFVNIKPEHSNIMFDATKTYPLRDKTIDVVMSMNLMEHLDDYETHIKESHRVLKDKGKLILFVPFSMYYHKDPKDYWRFTKDSLSLIFSKYFKDYKIICLSYGPYVLSSQYLYYIYKKIYPLRFLAMIYNILIDELLFLLSKIIRGNEKHKTLLERYTIGYFVVAVK